MTTDFTKPIGQLAIEHPEAIQVFEQLGIDYCCGGNRPLSEACAKAGVSPDDVMKRLEQTTAQRQTVDSAPKDWRDSTLSELISHILDTHHVYTKRALAQLSELLRKVCSAHAENHAELRQIQALFNDLSNELPLHMMKEERVLFPYLVEMEAAAAQNQPAPAPVFGTVRNPIGVMMEEHDTAGEILAEIRRLSQGYLVPADGCASYQALYQGFTEFERDLHLHIHLENNILFPRAIALEDSSSTDRRI